MIPSRSRFIFLFAVVTGLAGLLLTSCAQAPAPAPTAPRPKVLAPVPPPPAAREFNTVTPFILTGGLDDLPAGRVDQVQFFAGQAEFRRFCADGRLNVWPVGRFAADARPLHPAEFERVLRAQAAAIGADYVVVLTASAGNRAVLSCAVRRSRLRRAGLPACYRADRTQLQPGGSAAAGAPRGRVRPGLARGSGRSPHRRRH
ncbi:MAG: hypothetical protein WDM96_09610 [Lacunisphaera sp.]